MLKTFLFKRRKKTVTKPINNLTDITDGYMDRQINRWIYVQMDKQMDIWIDNKQMDILIDG